MNVSRFFIGSLVAVAAVFVVQASDTYACPVAPKPTPAPGACSGTCPTVRDGVNWTSLNMNQTQGVVGNKTNVTMAQQSNGRTATFFGEHALSSSEHFAKQEMLGGAPTKAQQTQGMVSGARTEFQANRLPSWTTVGTMGNVTQNQSAWSAHPLTLKQAAGTDQRTQIGEAKTLVQGQEQQVLTGATGDPYQRQNISGSSQGQGYTSQPFPQVFNLGTTFRQVVNFSVDNIFAF